MYPTVTRLSKGSPVRPSYRTVLPSSGRPAWVRQARMSSSWAPSNTGVITFQPNSAAARPRWTSSTWPMFIREGTPRGFRTISRGRPSGR